MSAGALYSEILLHRLCLHIIRRSFLWLRLTQHSLETALFFFSSSDTKGSQNDHGILWTSGLINGQFFGHFQTLYSQHCKWLNKQWHDPAANHGLFFFQTVSNQESSHSTSHLRTNIWVIWVNMGKPPNHPLKNRVFHYFHHPFWGFSPYFWFNIHMRLMVSRQPFSPSGRAPGEKTSRFYDFT